ncbi:sodium/potassium-transporting ATPase subunit beta-3-like isoform X1 [Oreochromis aureus]|uniref:Sodium/potassium-transporting ATPase subunit beta n=1 Tax=Oreochromis aureus TaxID=47969 RepID=A0A668SBM2_OREAU|nr:sodium/potassium-transporting ATPase subunit beta-3-like isoform X1 [Oreochromis aureus]
MSSSPQVQTQKPNQDQTQEPNQDQTQGPNQDQNQDNAKEEVKAEEKEEKKEEKREKKEDKKEANEAKREQKKEKQDSWKDFIYNPRTGEFLGRTAGSWGLILLFYLIFYGFLGNVFSYHVGDVADTRFKMCSRHQDRVASPGLVIRPHAVEITFNRSDPENYKHYIRQLHDLLQSYNDSIQERNELCMVGEYTTQDNEPVKKVCQFKRSTLRQCSGLPDPSFGFKEGKPCIIIKMNRVIGLKPEGDPYINCTAKRATSLQMQYFPSEGRLDKMFFPYYGKKSHPDYVQPLVAVKLLFTKEDYNIEQTVECKVEGSNLRNDDERDKFLGRVTFRVKVSE